MIKQDVNTLSWKGSLDDAKVMYKWHEVMYLCVLPFQGGVPNLCWITIHLQALVGIVVT
jgi:hypothetical protein